MADLAVNQTEAAERCGVSRSVFSYWVSAKGTLPALENVDRVAAFLEVEPDDVLAFYPATYRARMWRAPSTDEQIADLRAEVQELTRQVEKLTELVARKANRAKV